MSVVSTALKLRGLQVAAVSAALMLSATTGLCEEVQVSLSGAEEMPPVTTAATATGKIKVSADRTISGQIVTSGIEATSARIHVGPAGERGPAIISLKKGTDGTWKVPPGAVVTEAQYRNFKAGYLYIDVESTAHSTGEIRGQIKP